MMDPFDAAEIITQILAITALAMEAEALAP
jgi:hypothetical protein